jgi:hypothetical protein
MSATLCAFFFLGFQSNFQDHCGAIIYFIVRFTSQLNYFGAVLFIDSAVLCENTPGLILAMPYSYLYRPPFPPHDPSDAGSIPAEVVEFFRTEKFGNTVLRKVL